MTPESSTQVDPSGDQPFRHYTMRHRAVAWVSQNLFDHLTYTVRHGLLKDMKRKGGLGWLPEFLSGPAVTPEYVFWNSLDLSGKVIYDVGAFQGLLTLFFARRGRQIISYEPNSRNHNRLKENLRLNGLQNVTVRKVGLSSEPGTANMVASPLMPGGASIEPEMVSGLMKAQEAVVTEEISITTLDADIRELSLPAPDLIKIDVEGGELAVLNGARETLKAHQPALFLEMHGETMNLKRQHVAAIVAFLEETGYGEIRHVESGARITSRNSALAAEGHLYCP